MDNLKEEIASARKNIKTDDYSMSIGELINLYKDGEIMLTPPFQRVYRWEDDQKTKLIESILIGIPIPEIFVVQKADGTWHVIDINGVQILSAILQLVGELRESKPLKLTHCKHMPSLKDRLWGDLPISTQREFKKSKIRVNIILSRENEEAIEVEKQTKIEAGKDKAKAETERKIEEFFDLFCEIFLIPTNKKL